MLSAIIIFNRFSKPTAIIKITFQGAVVPSTLKKINSEVYILVEHYQPIPLRCFQCQGFGHTANTCNLKAKYARCAGNHNRNSRLCQSHTICCQNCGGNHTSRYRMCPEHVHASKIQTFKNTHGCSWVRAVTGCQLPQRQMTIINPTTPAYQMGQTTDQPLALRTQRCYSPLQYRL